MTMIIYENFPLYLLENALKCLWTHLSSASRNNVSAIKVHNNIKHYNSQALSTVST